MQSFKVYHEGTTLISPNVDISQILDNLSLEYKFQEDYILLEDITRDDVSRAISSLPEDVDYDVFANVISPDSDDEVFIGDNDDEFIDLEAVDSESFMLVIFLYNMDIEELPDDPTTNKLELTDNTDITSEAKRIIKVNSKGQRRIKIKCKTGFRRTQNKCVKISGAERTNKRRAIKKSVRTKKAKGSGFRRIVNIKTKKANRKRKSMGLNRR